MKTQILLHTHVVCLFACLLACLYMLMLYVPVNDFLGLTSTKSSLHKEASLELVVGEPEIQKLARSGRKVAEF